MGRLMGEGCDEDAAVEARRFLEREEEEHRRWREEEVEAEVSVEVWQGGQEEEDNEG